MLRFLLIFLFSLPVLLFAQGEAGVDDDSYLYYLNEGKALFEAKDFERAKRQFRVAIQEAKTPAQSREAGNWFEKADDADRNALLAALKAAEIEREKAKISAWESESSRLALTAFNEMEERLNYESAFQNALQAKITYDSLERGTYPEQVERAFGQSVQLNFTKAIFSSDEPITSFVRIPNSDDLIVITDNRTVIRVSPEGEAKPIMSQRGSQILTSNVSPDGKHLFAAYKNKQAFFVDIETIQYRELQPHAEPIVYAVFSPDGQYILSCSRDNKAKLWNLAGDSLAVMEGHRGNIYGGAFSPTEEKILTRSADGTARLWNYQGKRVGKVMRHNNYIHSAVFSEDGSYVLTSSADGMIRLWDTEGDFQSEVVKHEDVAIQAAYLPNSEYVYSYSIDKDLKLIDQKENKMRSFTFDQPVSSIMFNEKGVKLFTGQMDGQIREYLIEEEISEGRIRAHNSSVLSIQYLEDKNLLLSTGQDNTAKLWTPDRKLWLTVELRQNQIIPAQFSNDGSGIYAVINNQLSFCPLPGIIYDEYK